MQSGHHLLFNGEFYSFRFVNGNFATTTIDRWIAGWAMFGWTESSSNQTNTGRDDCVRGSLTPRAPRRLADSASGWGQSLPVNVQMRDLINDCRSNYVRMSSRTFTAGCILLDAFLRHRRPSDNRWVGLWRMQLPHISASEDVPNTVNQITLAWRPDRTITHRFVYNICNENTMETE